MKLILLLLLQIDPEQLAVDKSLLQELASHRGRTIQVDPNTRLGQFLGEFGFGRSSVAVTDDVIARAQAVRRYFAEPRYFPGKQILIEDGATHWITHRATIKEVLPGDQYRVEVVEVLEWNSNKSPKTTRTVERTVSHDEVARFNDPTKLEAGRSYFGIRYEPVGDPLLRDAIERANRIVDENYPDFRKSPAEVAAQQRTLYLELMKVAKMMDHSLGVSPGDTRYRAKMDEVRADPFYGSRSSWAGAYIKGEYGVCTDQASVAVQIVNSAARRAGIDLQLVGGTTLAENAGHGFTVANFRGDKARRLSDPSWENNKTWWRSSPPARYDGQLLLELEHALGSAGWGRNRRILRTEGEQVRTPAPSQRPVLDRAKGAVKRQLAGAGQFAAAYLLKEAMNGRIAVGDLKEPQFWGDLAVFTGAASLVNRLPLQGIGRAALPLAAGMAAVQLLHGQASLKDALIDTGSFLAAGFAVNLLADGLIYPILFAAGPPGWIAAGVYTVAKLAVTLYLGEKISGWIRGGGLEKLFGGAPPEREGVSQKIAEVNP